MCGIAGIVLIGRNVNVSSLKKMTDILIHRGPDGEGQWVNPENHAGLGHRRLAIIDLSDAAAQPMHSANGRYIIVFNGEIYNYIELREQLIKEGHSFKTQSDTEVLLKLYELKKAKCLQELDGMFAFAIWDEKEKELFCARDRFGEKPFYYHHVPGKHFYFASEMKALWKAGVPKGMNPDRVKLYLERNSIFSPNDLSETFYQGIEQLNASGYILLNSNLELKKDTYYKIETGKIDLKITEADAAECFRILLTESVRLRLRSDVPVGSSLSGGLDSSSIVMLMDQLKGDTTNQNTFSARFKGFAKDEGKFIHEVVKSCKNVTCHEVWPTGEQMIEDMDKVMYHQEEPFASASIFAQWKVMELARQKKVTVLLDGQGADEYLAGYLYFYPHYFQHLFHSYPRIYNKEYSNYMKLRGDTAIKKKTLGEKASLRMKIGRIKQIILDQQKDPNQNNSFRSLLHYQTTFQSLPALLRYADRNAMAHSREVRLPFLSHHLVDFAFTLSDQLLIKNGWTKYVLRKAMEPVLPKDITWRVDKIGYEPPQEDWMKNEAVHSRIQLAREKYTDLFGKELSSKASDWQLFSVAHL